MRAVVEWITLAVLAAPVVWLVVRWHAIPVRSAQFHHDRTFLWLEPALGVVVYLAFSEFGLLARRDVLRPGTRLAALRPMFRTAPEFERYTEIPQTGTPVGPVEIWIPVGPPVG